MSRDCDTLMESALPPTPPSALHERSSSGSALSLSAFSDSVPGYSYYQGHARSREMQAVDDGGTNGMHLKIASATQVPGDESAGREGAHRRARY